MEKVWDELKKIETQAEQVKNDAEDRAKKMVLLAKQDAEKLIENSKTYAEVESKKVLENAIEKASLESQEQLKNNEAAAGKLKLKAEKSMDKAVSSVVNAVLEDT